MAYRVELIDLSGNHYVIDNSNLNDRTHKTISPQLELEENTFGSLTLTVPCQNEYYNMFGTSSGSSIFNEEIIVVRDLLIDSEPLFRGRLLEIKRDSQLNRSVIFEGELSYLQDSVQEPATYENITPKEYLEKLFAVHNKKFPITNGQPNKQFQVGEVTVKDDDSADYITGRVNRGSYITDYTGTTWSYMQSLVSELGGYFKVEWRDGVRYVHYLKEYTESSNQKIEFGENLLDYAEEWSLADLYTVVYPLGADITEKDTNGESYTYTVTIASVNNGKVYYEANADVITRYGRREKQIKFSGIKEPGHLKQLAALYLKNMQFDNMTLNLTAVDLAELGIDESELDNLQFQSLVTVSAMPFGLIDRDIPITKVSLPLRDVANAVYSMSTNNRGIRGISTKITDYDKDAQDAIDELSEEVDEKIKTGLEEISAKTSGKPDDWIFGFPQIVFPKDELDSIIIYHSSYVTRAWDAVLSGNKRVSKSFDLPPSYSGDETLIYQLPEIYNDAEDQNMLVTHGVSANDAAKWAEIGSEGNTIEFLRGTAGVILLNNPQESGTRVLYLVVQFTPGTDAVVGFYTGNTPNFIGSHEVNGVECLCAFDGSSTWTPLRAKPIRGTGAMHTLVTTDKPIVLAFAHDIEKTDAYPFNSSTTTLMIGGKPFVQNDLISAVRTPEVSWPAFKTASNFKINYIDTSFVSPGGTSQSSYIGDGQLPAAGDPDHKVAFIRAVECRTNASGMITADEVVENIAWLVGRYTINVLNSDGVDLPPDGIVSSEEEGS